MKKYLQNSVLKINKYYGVFLRLSEGSRSSNLFCCVNIFPFEKN